LDLDVRVADLVGRIEVPEMASQLTARQCSALSRLGIPSYYWGTNALHSIREASCLDGRCPTAFPIPPNFAATFNMSLAQQMGNSFGTELRAMYNAGVKNSLDTWSPTININRDPREWSRKCVSWVMSDTASNY
jgi:beta-glucosidase-like glycosyl hydrolase